MRVLQINIGGRFHVNLADTVNYAETYNVDIILFTETHLSLVMW